MSLWMRVLSRVAPNWHWQMTCPDTIETAAQDFIDNHLPPLNDLRATDFDNIDDGDPWIAWRRRICAIYGISTSYSHPNGREPKRGWNRRLWQKYPDLDPEELVDHVFDTMIEFLRTTVQDSSGTVLPSVKKMAEPTDAPESSS
ncbi:hypothetical protein RMSM_03951 [Rhodopirellula maiorica SM1]|uniref:Uncharacterized protein n=1 Tax=Rhodopirellula maiorica SM1 TaxID=1265738 RepID=M5RIH3_9BACT|nr:hypothetical protein RMSM_03951 [Rhodopirellula maiorica SM1]